MGRLRNSRRKRHKLQQSRQRRPPESDPELKNTVVANKDSPTWNSLDERDLSPGADYAYNAGLSSDEMEVTRKLSCLNFSMIPCAPSSMMVEPQDMCVQGRGDGCDVETSDVDLCSEQAFTTQHDLLPTLSDREMETVELASQYRRHGRKRPAKRRPNRKAKRIKSASSSATTYSNSHTRGSKNSSVSFQPPPPLTVSFTRSSSKEHPAPLRRAKSFRRPRRSKPVEDPLLGFFSDTSAVCEMDVHQDHEWNTNDMTDYTPPAEGNHCIAVGSGFDQGVLTNESDLTESTTTDSGCEGDDEESSVEGPVINVRDHSRLVGWWDKGTMEGENSDDEKFTRILHGSFPLMSKLGQEQFKEQLESSMPEFKHPGRFGICRRSGPQKKRKPSLQQMTNSPTLKEVNQRVIDFVRNASETELRFNLVSRALCRTISCMARVYNLDCRIEQKKRLPVATPLLRKTPFTRLASQKEVEPILKNHGRESPTMILSNSKSSHHSHSLHNLGKSAASSSRVARISSMDSDPPCVVGGEAPALDGTNIGNRMLQCMGWTPGTGLGVQGNGIKDPVPAHIRPKYVGLGY